MTHTSSVLDERARLLARPHAREDGTDYLTVLGFRLGDERWVLDLIAVDGVVPLTSLAPLPAVPAHLLGVAPFHGRMVAVVDLRALFTLPPRGLGDAATLVVVHGGGIEAALAVDAVTGVATLDLRTLTAPGQASLPERHLRGVAADGTALLDIHPLLRDLIVPPSSERSLP